jgi:hypothetical protein
LSDRRPKDKFGNAAGYAHVSSRAHALDVDFARLMGPSRPLRSFESVALGLNSAFEWLRQIAIAISKTVMKPPRRKDSDRLPAHY